jgi:hypothetical protein
MRYICQTLFDITPTGVTGHYRPNRHSVLQIKLDKTLLISPHGIAAQKSTAQLGNLDTDTESAHTII